MRTLTRKEKLTSQITLAFLTGMFSMVPSVFASPVFDASYDFNTITSDGIDKAGNSAGGETTTVNGDRTANVVGWKDFSAREHDIIHFNGSDKNYLNVVTGAATSQIDGRVDGGKNVYLMNPYGVVIGETGSIDVGGNLYISTRAASESDVANFVANSDSNPDKVLKTTSKSGLVSDVVNNGGEIVANKVVLEGANIRLVNTNDIKLIDDSNITAEHKVLLHSPGGYIHVGYESDNYNSANPVNVTDYSNASYGEANLPSKKNYEVYSTENGSDTVASKPITPYMLVHNKDELQKMNTNTSGNYMLTDNIVFDNNVNPNFTPISNFTGNFDGMFHTISNMKVETDGGPAGLFASAGSGVLENVGFFNASVVSKTKNFGAGALAGSVTGETIRNVYSVGGNVSAATSVYGGGLVGVTNNGTNGTRIESSYTSGVDTGGGAIVGNVAGSTELRYVYGDRVLAGAGGLNGGDPILKIVESYTTRQADLSGVRDNNYDAEGSYYPDKDKTLPKSASDYSAFNISNEGAVEVDPETGKLTRHTWRIYEGQTLPLLTAFFKGTATADYTYDRKYKDGATFADRGRTGLKSGGEDWERTYDGGKVAPTAVSFYGAQPGAGSYTLSNDDTTYAGSYTMVYSDQQGYDITGSNLKVNKRLATASITGTTGDNPSKEYDGTYGYSTGKENAGWDTLKTSFPDASGDVGILKEDGEYMGLTGRAEEQFFDNKTDKNPVKDVGTGYYVKYAYDISTNEKAANYNAKIAESYDIQTVASGESENGTITPRVLEISLKDVSAGDTYAKAFTKTYNKTADLRPGVTAGNYLSDTTDSLAASEGIQIVKTGVTAQYDGVNAGSRDVIYDGISLTSSGDGKISNYAIVADGKTVYNGSYAVAKEQATGTEPLSSAWVAPAGITDSGKGTGQAIFTGVGTINPRELLATDFNISDDGSKTKIYDGTADYTPGTVAVTAPENDKIKTAGESGAVGADGEVGLIAGDDISFAPTTGDKRAWFSDGKGNRAWDVTGGKKTNSNGSLTAEALAHEATHISYGVNASGDNDTLGNYTLNGKTLNESGLFLVGSALTSSTNGITPRTISLARTNEDAAIDKDYDGNAAVVDNSSLEFGKYVDYASGAGADNKLVSETEGGSDGVTIGLTGAYNNKGTEAAKDVYYANEADKASRTASAKDIVLTAALKGENAANYALDKSTFDGVTGKINPRTLSSIQLTGINKQYDGTSGLSDTAWTKAGDNGTSSYTLTAPATDEGISIVSGDNVKLDLSKVSGGNYYKGSDVVKDAYTAAAWGDASPTQEYTIQGHTYIVNDLLSGNDAANYTVASTGAIQATGWITPREITADKLNQAELNNHVDADGNTSTTWSKVYDNSSVYDINHTVSGSQNPLTENFGEFKTDVLVSPNVYETIQFGIDSANFVSNSGALVADANAAVADASKATAVRYAVSMKGKESENGGTADLGNYKLANTSDTATLNKLSTINVDKGTNSGDVVNIEKRNIYLDVVPNGTITKFYDGTVAVDGTKQYDTNGTTEVDNAYPTAFGNGTTGYVKYASNSDKLVGHTEGLTADGVSIDIKAAYNDEDVADANKVNFKAVLSNTAKAKNYIINYYNTAATGSNGSANINTGTVQTKDITGTGEADRTVALEGYNPGTITKKNITVTLNGVDKEYDTTETATITDTVAENPVWSGF